MSAIADKYRHIAEVVERNGITSVLDVGCRDAGLRASLPKITRYVGVDLFQNAKGTVDVVCNVSAGLPVPDRAFEAVVALDLLEHLDDMAAFLEEMDRASSGWICVALPNLAHMAFRLNFLLTGRLSGKYDLKYGGGVDRHRWLTVVPQTDAFIQNFVSERGYSLTQVDLRSGNRRHRMLESSLRALGFSRAWHVWRTLYVIAKPANARASARATQDMSVPGAGASA